MAPTPDSHPVPAPNSPNLLDVEFARWISDLLDKHHILGASVAVVDKGEVESTGYGLARLPDVPSTADTIYPMASTSKAIGAATIGLILEDETKIQLLSDGKEEKIVWSTPISAILGEDFDLNDDYFTKNVTIEDALSNRPSVCVDMTSVMVLGWVPRPELSPALFGI